MSVPFLSEMHLRNAYREKLVSMLKNLPAARETALASFILVCANAYFDAQVHTALASELQAAFDQLHAAYTDLFARGQVVEERYAEDLLVFLKMTLVGLERLQITEHSQVENWQVQFNHLRSFRPQRAAARPVASIDAPFIEHSFFYDPELCERESFWSGDLEGKQAFLLYNKYPFARLHALLIPEPDRHQRQFLEQEYHHWAWQSVKSLAREMPGFGLGYNALGTFASVNHLHFQTFIEPRGMPVTWEIWRHNGGDRPYPAQCRVFDSCEIAWDWLDSIHRRNLNSYNLLYTPGRLYAFERRRQGTYKHSRWTSGFAWFEMSGNLITFSREDYLTISSEQIQREFLRLSVVDKSS
jgi:hypothetical protein